MCVCVCVCVCVCLCRCVCIHNETSQGKVSTDTDFYDMWTPLVQGPRLAKPGLAKPEALGGVGVASELRGWAQFGKGNRPVQNPNPRPALVQNPRLAKADALRGGELRGWAQFGKKTGSCKIRIPGCPWFRANDSREKIKEQKQTNTKNKKHVFRFFSLILCFETKVLGNRSHWASEKFHWKPSLTKGRGKSTRARRSRCSCWRDGCYA